MEEKHMIGTTFNPEKMYTYLRGYASGAGMKETLKALAFAREKHNGQFRKSGEPYIVHPLTMACNAVSMGIREDAVIATILLHDVCEDCGVSVGELPVSDAVKHAVDLMTFRVMEGETKEIAKEIVRNDALDRVFIATDYFDASINRISAWVTGVRNVQKALLFALLQPETELKKLQDENNFTEIMYLQEEMKMMPIGDVWEEFLSRSGVEANYLAEVKKYENEVLLKR